LKTFISGEWVEWREKEKKTGIREKLKMEIKKL